MLSPHPGMSTQPRCSSDQPRTRVQEVRSAWVQDLKEREDADTAANYFPFVISNIASSIFSPSRFAPSPDEVGVVRRLLTKCCEEATSVFNGLETTNNVNRLSSHCSVGCVVLPAEGYQANALHLHGWLRVPITDTGRVQTRIHDRQMLQLVTAPVSINAFVTAAKRFFSGVDASEKPQRASVWFAHRNGRVISDRAQNHAAKEYCWKEWKQEVRRWEDVEFVPNYLFKRLNAKRVCHAA